MDTENSSEQAVVTDNAEAGRYEVRLGDAVAGVAEYRLDGDVIDFTHTEVGEEYGGRGLAKELASHALDDARSRGLQVLPHCEFFAKYISRNPEYAELVPADQRATFGL